MIFKCFVQIGMLLRVEGCLELRSVFDLFLGMCAVIVEEFDVQSRRTGMNGYQDDEAGHGDNYLRPPACLSSDAFTLVLPTQLDNISGDEIQKMKDASKDAGSNVEVVLPRLKLGSISSVGQQSGPLEHVLSGNKMPMLKASSMSLQTILTNDSESDVSTSDSIQESSYGTESTNVEVEVEKRKIFTSGSESTQVSKLSSKHHFTPLAHLNVNFELDEVMENRELLFRNPCEAFGRLTKLSFGSNPIHR